MSRHLSHGQRALLLTELELRQRRLDANLTTHQEGTTRVEHAREVLLGDEDSTRRHAMDREVDMALSDIDLTELGAVSRALKRLRGGEGVGTDYGLCIDCGAEIPFDRLKAEPQAERCVACEGHREQRRELRR
jgi:DnaK suppressor protein